jgi:Carboxypeptidase regulatory-like domain
MKTLAAFVVTGILFAGAALAQTVNGSVGGTVTDATGAVVPHANVVITGIDTGVATKTTSNESGAYDFPSLQQGNYKLSVTMTGFQEVVISPVVLDVSAQLRLNVTLPVSSAGSTKVEVMAAGESPLLASSAVVGGIVTGQQILDLPLIDTNAANLALTQAQFAGGIGGAVSVAGGSAINLGVTVNGISVSNTRLDRAGGLLSFQLTQSVDMIEEVKVVSSPADAENGRSLGQVSMIVRSGTNQFHGSVADGLRNTDLDANTFWNNYQGLPRQDLKRNQYAARIGGPIRKNKTFFFALYDGNRQVTSASSTSTVLTAAARAGNFRFFPGAINANYTAAIPTVDASGNPVRPSTATGALQTVSVFGLDPNRPNPDGTGIVSKFVGETPLPNNFTVGDGLNTAGYTWAIPSFADTDQFTFKVDHYFSQSHHMNIVVTHEHQWYTSTTPIYPTAPGVGLNQDHSWFASIGFTSTLKSTVLNEFKIGLQHPDLSQVSGTRAYPQLYPSQNNILYTPGFSSFTSPIPGSIDSELIDPVYTIGDSLSWTHGRHSVKWGFQGDFMSSNSFNINNGVVPTVTLGAGSVAVQGVSGIAGLVSANQTLMTSMLTDLTGSLSSITEGFGVANGKNPAWIVYPGRRAWRQRDAMTFIKDDFKIASNLTLNIGVRWDWVGVPWDAWGRTPEPVGGLSGLFGVSGTNFANAMWSPGASAGSLTQIQTVGPNSANPNQQLYKDYYKGFEPAVGLSWAIPYFGANKTVLRAGWSFTRPMGQSFLTIDGATSTFGTTATVSSVASTFLNAINLPLSPTFSNPLQIWPINDKTQSINSYDPNFQPPVVQNFNLSLERQLTSSMTLAIRYVGNRSSHLSGGYNLNFPNVFENGIANATNITAAGGNASLFDKLLMGINVPGAGVVNGTSLTGSMALRAYTGTFGFLAANGAGNIANFFNTTQALGPAGTTPVRGWLLGNAGLPNNFVVVNPQYSGATFTCACLNADYNSGVVELNRRFSHGFSFQGNFVWAKSMSLNGTAEDPRNWNLQRAQGGQKYTWKASGTYELPFGRGKQFLNATSGAAGVVDKIIGNWQVGAIFTHNTGSYLSPTCAGDPYGGTDYCTSAMALPGNPGHVIKGGKGVTFFDSSQFGQVNDPYCASLTTLQGLQSRCTDKAITYNGNILFENSAQGQLGTMSSVTNWTGPGLFDLDMDLLKRFTVKERVTMDFRIDAISVTNTAHFTNPNMSVNGTTFGVITAPSSGGSNSFTTPPLFFGNRVYVANLRVTF